MSIKNHIGQNIGLRYRRTLIQRLEFWRKQIGLREQTGGAKMTLIIIKYAGRKKCSLFLIKFTVHISDRIDSGRIAFYLNSLSITPTPNIQKHNPTTRKLTRRMPTGSRRSPRVISKKNRLSYMNRLTLQ